MSTEFPCSPPSAVVSLFASVFLLTGMALAAEPARVFDVRQHGAKGDGHALDTAAIQTAIDACGKAGGGRVLFPAGKYISGTLRLASGVDMHFAKDARLIGVADLEAYGGFTSKEGEPKLFQSRWHRGLIIGEHLHDISFTGPGTIDGNKVYDPRGEEKMRGPHTILLGHCRNITVRDLTIHESANYAFLAFHAQKVRVENAAFEGGWDGVHFRGAPAAWNRDIRITNCRFFTGDDCIAGGYIEDGVVENCTINSSCNGVRLIGPARRLSFSKCDFYGPGKFEHRSSKRTNMLAAFCLQPSGWDKQPGPMEDVSAADITMREVSCPFHIVIKQDNTAQRLKFERVKATGVYRAAASVESWGDETVNDVTFKDVDIQYTGGGTAEDARLPIKKPPVDARKLPVWGLYLRGVNTIAFEDVRLSTKAADARPMALAEGVGKFTATHTIDPPKTNPVRPLDREDFKLVERPE